MNRTPCQVDNHLSFLVACNRHFVSEDLVSAKIRLIGVIRDL